MFKIDFASLNSEQLIALASSKLNGSLEDWEKVVWQFIQTWFDPKINSITVNTSGSTGVPKSIEHSKQFMLNSAAMTCMALDLKPGNNALLCLPANKIGGMMMIVRCIYNRMDLYCIKPSATPLSNLSDDVHVDFAAFTPMQFYQVVEQPSILKRAERISQVILGGEDVGHKLLQQTGTMQNEVYVTFGMTETISHIALKRISGNKPDKHFTALPGIKVSTDERSCLIIEAPDLGQPQLHTNDIVSLISNTQFDWLGRVDNVINSGGVKVYAEEIEQKLQPAINSPFFVGAIADELTGQKVVLAIEAENLPQNEIDRLKKLLDQFDKIRRPKEILFIPKFVRTENGKIKRKDSINLLTT